MIQIWNNESSSWHCIYLTSDMRSLLLLRIEDTMDLYKFSLLEQHISSQQSHCDKKGDDNHVNATLQCISAVCCRCCCPRALNDSHGISHFKVVHLNTQLHDTIHYSCAVNRRAFSVACCTVWNSLPDFIQDLTISAECFRRLLKTYLFTRY